MWSSYHELYMNSNNDELIDNKRLETLERKQALKNIRMHNK